MKKMLKDLSWLHDFHIAHRGLHSKDGLIPENSKSAFDLALKAGYAIECDVNVLKDGTAVVFHDHTLKRLSDDHRLLSEVNWSDVENIHLGKTTEKIVRFDSFLKDVNGQTPLLIELKPHGNTKLLCQSVMMSLKDYQGQFAIFSFHPKVVYYLKKHHPEVIRGQIAESFRQDTRMPKMVKWMMKKMIFNVITKPDFISYGIKDLPNKQLDRLKQKGLTIISYAAQSQAQLDFVKSHYHNVVFEYFTPTKKG
ncbi:MAG: hypothetical protein A2Y45_03515 [Tenericutes bacterium GWC2_34_14]|nr:MAG: hypothetical protein A2Z84_07255 [Tenericutes bacterium GWA2_35_7]OHE29202.1 MAG: hypothetical protein A2Y45_03515 [Tenericutes bacterium GWC2_34_14]OHE34285.1 MAG: hypothetical protein A2012_09105 [Tenericutes bacterium GWE2_34_108]OHE35637.1 MAG: hypothetical protein A2Y46_05870 [Tenericutes bacterium GWF1_35_14]OHE38852.1 MAG: hypothetical protein A2Y44_00305 [Tenericutes bacterium GWF2_35_184]OHE43613.1 MAG: hypothetical protein A3K26_00185 [Tenericutes bacterium RIFOXYA12_FULL_35_